MQALIPFLDLSASYRELQFEIDAAIARVLASGCYILGPEVETFEAEWAESCEAAYAVGLANGLDALTLDDETERAVMSAIESLSKDLTIILIAHRITTLKTCDQIVVLRDGQVEKQGTYEQVFGNKVPSPKKLAQGA